MIEPHIRCQEFVECVTDWMDDALDVRTHERFEEHMVICPPCTTYVQQIRRSISVVGELGSEAPPPNARAALLETFRREYGLPL